MTRQQISNWEAMTENHRDVFQRDYYTRGPGLMAKSYVVHVHSTTI